MNANVKWNDVNLPFHWRMVQKSYGFAGNVGRSMTTTPSCKDCLQLQHENWKLQEENRHLWEMIPLLRQRLDGFLIWFENTVKSIH